MKLVACASTVANAAPNAPQPNFKINSISSSRFRTAANAMIMNGRLESPMPRMIALVAL